jgi:hypothetical protein
VPPNQNVRTPRSNINTGNVNVGNTVNVGGSDWGWGGNGAWGAVAAGVTAGAIAGSIASGPGTVVYSLPPSCTTVYVNGISYQSCDGAYYQPSYQGSTVVYQTVPSPY